MVDLPTEMQPTRSPYQISSGRFLEEWPADLRKHTLAFVERRAVDFFRSRQLGTFDRVVSGCGALVELRRQDSGDTSAPLMRCTTMDPVAAAASDAAGVTTFSPEKLKYYTKTVSAYECIAKVSDHCDCVRIVTKPALFGLISTREFVDVVCNYRCRDGTQVAYSTEAPPEVLARIPSAPGVVRGRDLNTATSFTPVASETEAKCKMVMEVQSEVGGSLPTWMVQKALPQTLVDSVRMTREMLARWNTFADFCSTANVTFDWAQRKDP